MKAIILAAGYGKRMRPLTHTTHKTLLEIKGRTVIQWIIDALLENHVTDIVIVTGYQAEAVQAYLSATYPDISITYVHNARYAQTNNIFSLALALETISIDGDIILIECDLIFEPAVLARLLRSGHPNVALVDRYHPGMDGTVVQVKDGAITEVITPHRQDAGFHFEDKYKTLNIYRFSQEFCAGTFKKLLTYYARYISDNEYYELILGIIIHLQHEVIHAEILDGEKWAELDDPNDIAIAGFTFDPAARKQILDEAHGGYWNYDILDFCYLRNMYFPTGAVLSELRNNLPRLAQNYGSAQNLLNRKLASYLLCRAEYLTVLNGLSQVYPLLQGFFYSRQLATPHVMIPYPTFGEYARILPQATPYFDEVGLDLPDIAAQLCHHEVIVLVNPNNPTGSTLPTRWIYDLAALHPQKLVIIDESFIDFSGQDSILPLLEAAPLPNVILLKSLSKVLGVPGLRLGYVYTSNVTFNAYLHAAIPIWNLNAVAEYLLERILKHRESIRASFQQTIQDRAQFAAELTTLPLVKQVYPSGGNFLLVSLQCFQDACQVLVEDLLSRHGIYVKDVSHRFRGSHAYLRLAVRLPAENARLVAHLRTITSG